MSDITAHSLLVAAKGYLLNNGWFNGGWGDMDGNGPRCIVGALIAVSDGRSVTCAHGALIAAAHSPLMPWNDAPSRTFDEVISLIDKAIIASAPAETTVEEPVPA